MCWISDEACVSPLLLRFVSFFSRTFFAHLFFRSNTNMRRPTCRIGRKEDSSLTTLSKASSKNGRPIHRASHPRTSPPIPYVYHSWYDELPPRWPAMYVMGLISQGDRPISSRSVRQTDVFLSVCDGISSLSLCSPQPCSNHRSRFHISSTMGFLVD